jgi:F-type H+-transporting ATPase subunit b
MDIFLQLANQSHVLASEMEESAMAQSAGRGFGLNLDIFEANVFNLAIVIGILVYFGREFLSSTLGNRSAAIEKAFNEAEVKRAEMAKLLAAQQEKLKSATAEAAGIVAKADGDAKKASQAILTAAAAEVARMKQESSANLDAEQAKILNELRVRIAELAMAKAEAQIPARLNATSQQTLVDRSISLLGGQ